MTGDCHRCGAALVDNDCAPCSALLYLLLEHPPEPCRVCVPPFGLSAVPIQSALGRMDGEHGPLDAAIYPCTQCGAVRKMPLRLNLIDDGLSVEIPI